MNFPKHSAISSGRKRATNVSIDSGVIDAAKQLGININQIAEAALTEEIRAHRKQQWQAENKAAIDSFNAYVEEHGLPLAKYRMF